MGRQNTKIIVITNEELRHDLSELNNQIGGWPAGNDPFYDAPVVILVASKKGKAKEYVATLSGNMMLAAYAPCHMGQREMTIYLDRPVC